MRRATPVEVSGTGITSGSRSAFTAHQLEGQNRLLGKLLSLRGLTVYILHLVVGLEIILFQFLTKLALTVLLQSGYEPV